MRKVVVLCLLIFCLFGAIVCRVSDRVVMLVKKNDAKVPFWVSRGRRNCLQDAGSCLKRATIQDELGPFWANRGKKDKIFRQEPLYVEEPKWIITAKDYDADDYLDQPFFITRGKKTDILNTRDESSNVTPNDLRDRRFISDEDVPFQAARGKKNKNKIII